MANVGKHCVIGAGSVVTKAIPDYAIAIGSPARIVRYRNAIESPERTGNPVSLSDVN
jgi:acetyltransferase-like isoleucine patch superfamily enzyme